MNLHHKRISAVVLSTAVLMLLCIAALNAVCPLPKIYKDGPSTVVTSSDGRILRSFGNAKGVHRYKTSVSNVSPFYIKALLDYEDRYFYYHPGINIFSLLRAGYQWAINGKIISGGSTITMQVARLIEPHPRTILGKLRQIWRAVQLEWYFSKNEILTMYLNLAPFGGNIEGVEAASRHLFSKAATSLNKNEAALLVVLPQKPSAYRPDRHPTLAKKMRNKVLRRLNARRILSTQETTLLTDEDVYLRQSFKKTLAPLLSRFLKQQYPHQHVIQTTIDYGLQLRLAKLLSRTARTLPAKASTAALVIENKQGNVLAYQGAIDFFDADRFGHVDMVRAIRSPGSTLKPFIYGLGFDQGVIHTESLLSDIPTSFGDYKPQNLNRRFIGAVSASTALKKSLNVPAIQVLNSITPEAFDTRLKKANIHLRHKKSNLSVGLGGTGTSLWELAKMYRSLAATGNVSELHIIPSSTEQATRPLLSEQSSWMVFSILGSISAPDRIIPSTRRKIAWKTGTSYGYRDFWSIGVSPDYTVAVWVGRPDATPLIGFLGATLAAPVMFDIFDLLPRDTRNLRMPDGVEKTRICWPGGRAFSATAPSLCQTQKYAYTIRGITPPTLQSSGYFVTTDSLPGSLREWQRQQQIITAHDNAPSKLAIIGIRTGQHYFQDQITSISLSTNQHSQPVKWYVNYAPIHNATFDINKYLGETAVTACIKDTCVTETVYIH